MRKQTKKKKKRDGGKKHGRIEKNNFRVSFSKSNIKFKSHKQMDNFNYVKISAEHTQEHIAEVRMHK